MEDITGYLRRRLQQAGRRRWRAIAAEAGTSAKLPEKIVYGERLNPRVLTIQPLLDYFDAIDRGDRRLPKIESRETADID